MELNNTPAYDTTIEYEGATTDPAIIEAAHRNDWLRGGGERSVQLVTAVLYAIAQVPGYQRAVLQECLRRMTLEQHKTYAHGALVGDIVCHGLHFNRPYYEEPATELRVSFTRRDGRPVELT